MRKAMAPGAIRSPMAKISPVAVSVATIVKDIAANRIVDILVQAADELNHIDGFYPNPQVGFEEAMIDDGAADADVHEPRATHLAMLEALAGPCHLNAAYAQALQEGYLWHEFGDLHLLLP